MAIVKSQPFFFTFCRKHKWYNISFLALISTILNVMYTHNCKGLVYWNSILWDGCIRIFSKVSYRRL